MAYNISKKCYLRFVKEDPKLTNYVKKGIYLSREQEEKLITYIFDQYKKSGRRFSESEVIRTALDLFLLGDFDFKSLINDSPDSKADLFKLLEAGDGKV